jgi:hypothetical protein
MKFHDEISEHDEVSMKVTRIIFRRSLRWLIVLAGVNIRAETYPRRFPNVVLLGALENISGVSKVELACFQATPSIN